MTLQANVVIQGLSSRYRRTILRPLCPPIRRYLIACCARRCVSGFMAPLTSTMELLGAAIGIGPQLLCLLFESLDLVGSHLRASARKLEAFSCSRCNSTCFLAAVSGHESNSRLVSTS